MQITSASPVSFELTREGGSIITGRLDIWSATSTGWNLTDSLLFQKVKAKTELETVALPNGTYTVVGSYRVEESINGTYAFQLTVAGKLIGKTSGDVDTTANPNDTKSFKNQFILVVE